MIGVLESANDDGTVNVTVPGATLASLPAPREMPRREGDRVVIEITGGNARVTGTTKGSPVTDDVAAEFTAVRGELASEVDTLEQSIVDVDAKIWTITQSAKAPGSAFTKATDVYVDEAGKRLRIVTATYTPPDPPDPPTPPAVTKGTVTAKRKETGTYRGGKLIKRGHMEQGYWYGYGPDMGIAVFPANAFGALSGKTVTRLYVDLHRVSGEGITARQPVYMGWHTLTSLPGSTPTLRGITQIGSLGWNESRTFTLPTDWHAAFKNGTAKGVGIYHPQINVTLDRVTLHADWST
ncbi:hypothetical protein H9L10_03500 [Phycicoccus endophyticus]|uniref:Uncharacterized protein n=1 Tax=Phycicoccus endophyticus TaxID=1690220 RepID=A0A7G9R3F9_9MICO|nr:hypothetical protein [Phycicoccus endophyticus]NHI19890.1 hypothetical protein [Phycicoccus endophyticus]QNN50134.1 hypothetical protein H9L10_03500 [Phycicoccus endophyticus]GGL27745.1 hypothetical protein GCM10012283_07430 [Phycicoccus endophyticus]